MINAVILSAFAMTACGCFYIIRSGKKYTSLIWALYISLAAIAIYSFLSAVIFRIQNPAIWDFTAFYLYGKVAAEGYNFYDIENFKIVFDSLKLPFTDFGSLREEVVNVGFPYPPPTIFYFLPLGYLSYNTAIIVWTGFNILFVIGCIYLIHNMFFKSERNNGLILVIILFLISTQVRSTIFYSQTNFILLFLLLLMKKKENSRWSGLLLALAIFTKPYMIIFSLYFIFMKKWNSLLIFALSVILMLFITISIIGSETFLAYIFNNSANRLPTWVFSENINQSLHAVLLRHNIISVSKSYIYMTISMIILGLTTMVILLLRKKNKAGLIWVYLLLVGLLLYPGTLTYYGVILLFIVFSFMFDEMGNSIKPWIYIPLMGIFFLLSSLSVFLLICFLLLVSVLITFKDYLAKEFIVFHKFV